jgi:hypothetical protein
MLRALALTPLLLVVISTGCSRVRPTLEGAPASLGNAPKLDGLEAPEPISVERPTASEAVSSPVRVEGSVSLEPGRTLVGQVLSREGDDAADDRWRGNALLEIDDAGRFSGEIKYTLVESGPGVIELAIVDPASGTMLQRKRVEVQLSTAP